MRGLLIELSLAVAMLLHREGEHRRADSVLEECRELAHQWGMEDVATMVTAMLMERGREDGEPGA